MNAALAVLVIAPATSAGSSAATIAAAPTESLTAAAASGEAACNAANPCSPVLPAISRKPANTIV